jgi:uncharacterized protein YqeY
MSPSEPDLRIVLRTHLTRAIKHRDRLATAALRSAIAAIDSAEAVPAAQTPSAEAGPVAGSVVGLGVAEAPPQHLTARDVVAVLESEIAERRAAATEVEAAGDQDRAADLRREADVVEAALRFP